MMRHLILAGTAVTLLGACSMLEPRYERPAAPVPAAWQDAGEAGGPVAAAIGWREFITDERLRQVIALALENNRDLRVATLNIEKARAQYQIQRGELFPAIGVTGSSSNSRISEDLSSTGSSYISRAQNVGVGFSAYELDLFGRIGSLKKGALESWLATVETQRAAQTSLIAETANAWLTLAADLELLKLAQDTLRTRQESLGLTERSVALGVGSQLTLSQTRTTVETARADVASFTSQVARDRNALAVLVGGDLPAELLPAQLPADIATLRSLPAGVPSDVLQQRPDILAAEHQLRAANASIGAARAAFFPSITLTASAGSASNELSGLFSGGTHVWSFAPQINLPIFTGGRNLANLRVSKVQREIAVAQYEKAIQSAFREVADALAGQATLDEQLTARTALVEASSNSLMLSQTRFDRGLDSYLGLLDAQRSHYTAEQGLISTRLARLGNLITLYKALGGGVSAESAPAADTPPVE